MPELGPTTAFYVTVLLWVARTIVLSFICSLLALLGIRVLDALTPHIPHREKIGEDPVSIGLFIGGFFILIGLVIHGAVTGPMVVGGPIIESLIDPRRLGLVAVSFLVSLFLGIALFYLIDWLTPRIPFSRIKENPLGAGLHVFGYLIFFGLVINAALTTPL